jgi:hypothetical protein
MTTNPNWLVNRWRGILGREQIAATTTKTQPSNGFVYKDGKVQVSGSAQAGKQAGAMGPVGQNGGGMPKALLPADFTP